MVQKENKKVKIEGREVNESRRKEEQEKIEGEE